jgi:hypothetical protein
VIGGEHDFGSQLGQVAIQFYAPAGATDVTSARRRRFVRFVERDRQSVV